jgi:3-deoxy-D-manno-octulosonic-acid transferase
LRLLYILAVYLTAPIISAVLLARGLGDRSYWSNFAQRFGFGAGRPPGGVWLHAVSVGEVQASAPLVAALHRRHPQLPLTVTTFTPTGAARARALFGNIAEVRYVPYDLPGSVRRFLKRVDPRLAVIFETELWPNLYRECGRRRVPLVLASARVSERSLGRYRRLGALFSDALSQASIVAAQGEADAARFRALGADAGSTHVTGNLKFDFDFPEDLGERGRRLRSHYAPRRALWVAGSTHDGEEAAVLEAQRWVRGTYPDALLVIAPRHPARFAAVAQQLKQAGVSFARRSDHGGVDDPAAPVVLLLDSVGELIEFYAAADVAFVGGSLVPVGGHNLLEPAALGVPVLTGPHNFNGADVARVLINGGAAEIVQDALELGERVTVLLSDPAQRAHIGSKGRAAVAGSRGALSRLLALIEPLLA